MISLVQLMEGANDFEEADFLECACPYCGQTLSFPVTYVSTAQTCIRCMEVVIVPADGSGMAGKLPLPLITSRLQLRRFRPGDWKDVCEFWVDKDGPADEEDAIRWLETDAKSKLSEGQHLSLAIEMASSSKVIGYVAIHYREDTREQAHIYALVNRAFQRQGYAREAVSAMLTFGFEALRLHRITANSHAQEVACCRLLERVGLRREGEFMQDHRLNGEWTDTVWYAMLASEFRQRSAARQPLA